MENSFNFLSLLKVILKWRKALGGVTLLAAVGSVGVALWLPNYYEASSTFYLSNPALTDRQTLFNTQGSGESTIEYFGTKNDVDRALSIAKSASLAGYIINKYHLLEHYDIDTASTRYYLTKVNKEFEDNYTPIKTDLGGIEISVLDQDPALAAEIVNDIVDHIDHTNKNMVLENKKKIIEMIKGRLDEKRKELDQLSDQVSNTNPNPNKQKLLDSQLESAMQEFNSLSNLYDQHAASASDKISTIYVLEQAFAAEKKSKPIRWLIVLSSTLITFFLMLVVVVIIEEYHKIKPQLFDGK